MKIRSLAIALSLAASAAFAASPPWYFYHEVLKDTVGRDSCLKVGELDNPAGPGAPYRTLLSGCATEKMQALAQLLEPVAGNFVQLVIMAPNGSVLAMDPPATPDEAARALTTAFGANAYFAAVRTRAGFADVSLELKPLVVQVFSDNIADPYRMTNFVAQDAFAMIVRKNFGAYRVGIHSALMQTLNPLRNLLNPRLPR